MSEERIQEVWDEIWGLLEKEDPVSAVARILKVLGDEDEEPEYRYLLGLALMDAGEAGAAVAAFERAVELSNDWPDAYAALAWALFRACRFEDAEEPLATALELDPEMADSHQLYGLLAERAGDDKAATLAFAEARRLDPEAYPEPYEMDEDEFLEIARAAVDELDERTRAVLEETAFFVQSVPADELLIGADPPLDPQILGLFLGSSLLDQSIEDSGRLPNTMYLFQRNLERMADSREDLEEQIRITVLHEIAHQFGWGEEELEEKGFA